MPNKDKMSLLEENLKRLLPNYEISVHKDADSVGSDTQIRIIPIQNVKGFEFEAAFFFGVDTLEKEDPEMFERYVYVGSTRAATYLAFIAEETIPSVFRALDQTYTKDWSWKSNFFKKIFKMSLTFKNVTITSVNVNYILE